MSLQFSFQECLTEIDSFARVARDFIDPGYRGVFGEFRTKLEVIRIARRETTSSWEISDAYPLTTIVSEGEYEQEGRRGAHNVKAIISCKWEIRCPREAGPRSRAQNMFELTGIASTKVRLIEGQEDLAMWRMEVGDDASPGTHFHVQVLGETGEAPFPHSLSVPRLPGIVFSPMAVCEFVLAELFQAKWKQHAAQESADMLMWKPIQQRRFGRLLDWKKNCIDRSIGSPWTALKASKPAPDLFTAK